MSDDIKAQLQRIETKLDQLLALAAGKAVFGNQPAAGGAVFPPYGRSKGMPVKGAPAGDLTFYRNGAMRSLADPAKSRFHAKEKALLDAIEAEMKAQGIPVDEDRPDAPPEDDSALPF